MTTSSEAPKRPRAMLAAVVLASAVVSGGWLVEHGMNGGRVVANNGGARLFYQNYDRISRDIVDTLPDSTLYTRAVDGPLIFQLLILSVSKSVAKDRS